MPSPDLEDYVTKTVGEIEAQLSQNQLQEAIELLLDFAQAFANSPSEVFKRFRSEAVVLSASYNRLQKSKQFQTRENIEVRENSIIFDANDLARRLSEAVSKTEAQWNKFQALGAAQKGTSKTMVSLRSCYKKFSGFSLGPISLDIAEGDILALMGANASGKSTLLKMILGEIAASRGKIRYPGLPKTLKAWPYRGRRSNIGYVPQFPPEWKGPLRENLHYFLATRGVRGKENQERVEYYLQRFRLTKFQDLEWDEISGGFKLRFALARELLTEPALLILDEPLAHLDIESQFEFLDIIRSISSRVVRPITVVMTSQHVYETERVCSKVAILNDGKLVISTALSDLEKIHDECIFEIETEAALGDLEKALVNLSCKIAGRAPVYLVTLPIGNNAARVADLLASSALDFKSIRDVTSSTRIYFRSSSSER